MRGGVARRAYFRAGCALPALHTRFALTDISGESEHFREPRGRRRPRHGSLRGAFSALLLTGRPVGISALIGFLMLIGIVVTNAIVLLDLVERMRAGRFRCVTRSSGAVTPASGPS